MHLYFLSSFACVCVDVHLAGWGIAVSLWQTVTVPKVQVDVS